MGGGGQDVDFWSWRFLKTARSGSYRGFAWRGVCFMGGSIFAQAKVFFFPFLFPRLGKAAVVISGLP